MCLKAGRVIYFVYRMYYRTSSLVINGCIQIYFGFRPIPGSDLNPRHPLINCWMLRQWILNHLNSFQSNKYQCVLLKCAKSGEIGDDFIGFKHSLST